MSRSDFKGLPAADHATKMDYKEILEDQFKRDRDEVNQENKVIKGPGFHMLDEAGSLPFQGGILCRILWIMTSWPLEIFT